MEYKTSLNWQGKLLTSLVIIMAAYGLYHNAAKILTDSHIPWWRWYLMCTASVATLAILTAYCLSPRKYILSDGILTIYRYWASRKIPISEIMKAEIVPMHKGLSYGINGIFGWVVIVFYKDIGKVHIYARNIWNPLMLSLKDGRYIMISPDSAQLCNDINSMIGQ